MSVRHSLTLNFRASRTRLTSLTQRSCLVILALHQPFLAEEYPQLPASGGFRDLQTKLATKRRRDPKKTRSKEDAIQNARCYYNAVVRYFNTAVSTLPAFEFRRAFGWEVSRPIDLRRR